ncbi:MAG: 3-hydroxylacyl-ACP dehydratase [Pseudomonadota bacterium]
MSGEIDLPAGDLLPQKGEMCLLGRVLYADDERLVATAMFSEGSLFCRNGEVGSWVSLECMAQAVAAWAGYQGRTRGVAPRIGFLLGSSRFDCRSSCIRPGKTLRIEVTKEIQMDDGLGQFTGRTYQDEELLASAVITVISPEDPSSIIASASND